MNDNCAVKFSHVSKIYKLKKGNHKAGEQFYALKDLSFEVEKGDVVGVLGSNGSGKSTMSLLLAGISLQDEGTIEVNGEQALIAINTGLNDQLSGYENIYYKGALLGFKKKQIKDMVKDVVEFAEIGDFMDQPVKKYSSGMRSRLGFSISLALHPDILIVDEALSVGDKGFAQKCMNKMNELRDNEGNTIFFISHALPQVKAFCKHGLWIEGGELMAFGEINEVCEKYSEYIDKTNAMEKREKDDFRNKQFKNRCIGEEPKLLHRLKKAIIG